MTDEPTIEEIEEWRREEFTKSNPIPAGHEYIDWLIQKVKELQGALTVMDQVRVGLVEKVKKLEAELSTEKQRVKESLTQQKRTEHILEGAIESLKTADLMINTEREESERWMRKEEKSQERVKELEACRRVDRDTIDYLSGKINELEEGRDR